MKAGWGSSYSSVMEEYDRKRNEAIRRAEEVRAQLCRRSPAFAEADRGLAGIGSLLLEAGRPGPDKEARWAEARRKVEELRQKRAAALEAMGLPEDAADPKYCPDAAPIKGCRMSEMGVSIPAPAPVGVFVRFIPQPCEITFTEWSAEDEYAAGDLAYMTDRKECYMATGAATRGVNPAADGANWIPVRLSSTWIKYFTLLAASEIQTAEQGRYQTQAAAENEMQSLRERFLDFGGENDAEMGGYC